MCFISKNGSYFCVYPAVEAHTERRPACFACPSTVYCRGHHLPSVRVGISASTHQPPRPSALFTHQPPNESLAECHITQQRVCVCCNSVFLFHCCSKDFYCSETLRQRPLILWAKIKRDYWEAQLSGY